MAETQMASKGKRHVMVTFGRDVTEDDLKKLRATVDVLTVREAIDVDSDHVHGVERQLERPVERQ
jgi:hypothetical protein